MKKEAEDALFSMHPLLFAQRHLSGSVTRMCDGICVGNVLFDLINSMCEEFQTLSNKTGTQIEFVQCKEKFGLLRVYTNTYNEEIQDILSKYSEASAHVCHECGDYENVTTRRECWIETICDKCYADRQNK